MKKLITAFLIVNLSILMVHCGGSNRSVLLRLKYEPGDQITYRQEGTRHVKTTEGDSLAKEGTSRLAATIVQTVRRVLPDSTAEVHEATTWELIGPGKQDTTKIDTLHSTREMVLYLTPRGKVVDMEFTTDIDSTDAKYIRDYYEQGVYVFPEQALSKGRSWTQTSNVQLGDTTTAATTTYRVTGFSKESGHDVVIIDYDGHLIIPISPSANDSLHRSGLDHIRITGSMHFGYDIGQVVSISEKWVVDGDRQRLLKDGGESRFKVKMDMDVTMKLVELKKATS